MEYIQFGDLTNYMDAALRENDAKQIAYQVLDGIRVMHLLDIIHRDIKPGVSKPCDLQSGIGNSSRASEYLCGPTRTKLVG